jgi:hypothetical protein
MRAGSVVMAGSPDGGLDAPRYGAGFYRACAPEKSQIPATRPQTLGYFTNVTSKIRDLYQ